jgi:preprotein translocase subunit SecA
MVEQDDTLNEREIVRRVLEAIVAAYDAKTASVGEPVMRELEKVVMLRQLDSHWKEHIGALDYLRQGIGLRSFAQRNPKQEYKREAFEMFSGMLDRVKRETIAILSRIEIRRPEDVRAAEAPRPAPGTLSFQHAQAPGLAQAAPRPQEGDLPPPAPAGQPRRPAPAPVEPFVREQPKVGRNQPCPCGSGKKFKQCHGRLS